jgi:hypothetical protein
LNSSSIFLFLSHWYLRAGHVCEVSSTLFITCRG